MITWARRRVTGLPRRSEQESDINDNSPSDLSRPRGPSGSLGAPLLGDLTKASDAFDYGSQNSQHGHCGETWLESGELVTFSADG